MSGYDAIMDDRRMDEGNHVAGTANLLSDGLSGERTARVPTGQSQLSRLFEVNRDRVSGRSPDVIAGGGGGAGARGGGRWYGGVAEGVCVPGLQLGDPVQGFGPGVRHSRQDSG